MRRFSKYLLVIVIVILFVFQASCGNSSNSTDSTDLKIVQAKVATFEGDPLIINEENPQGITAFENMSVIKGDKIITGENERIKIIIMDSNEVTIDENSEILIDDLKEENGGSNQSFSVIKGKIWSDIKNKLNVNSIYEIKTPTAVMGVRGTKFLTSYINDMSKVIVVDGIVSVKLNNSKQEHLVKTFEQVEFSSTAKDMDIIIQKIVQDDLNDFDLKMIGKYIEQSKEVIDSSIKENNNDNMDTPLKDNINDNPIQTQKVDIIKKIDVIGDVDTTKIAVINLNVAIQAVTEAERLKTDIVIDKAKNLVAVLPETEMKTSLGIRLATLSATIAVEKAEVLITTDAVSQAQTLVGRLPANEVKNNLIARLDQLTAIIESQKIVDTIGNSNGTKDKTSGNTTSEITAATAKVVSAEEAATDVGTQDLVDEATDHYNDANTSVKALVASAEKTNLLGRLAAVKGSIDAAQLQVYSDAIIEATGKVRAAELATDGINDLITQNQINSATTLYNVANALVTELIESPEKTDLLIRINLVDTNIIAAQGILNDAVESATTKVTLAENSLQNLANQAEIDIAKALYEDAKISVDLLSELTNTTVLANRLVTIKNSIEAAQFAVDDVLAATDKVVEAEAAASAMTKQYQIDNAITLYDAANALVTELAGSTEKTNLLTRIGIVNSSINTAQDILNAAMLDATNQVILVELATNNLTNQGDIDLATNLYNDANSSVIALGELTDTTDLVTRLSNVKVIIDAAQLILDPLIIATNKVNAASSAAIVLTNQTLIDGAKILYNDANSSVIELNESYTTDRIALLNKLVIVKEKIDAAQTVIYLTNPDYYISVAKNLVNDAEKMVKKAQHDNTTTSITDAIAKIEEALQACNMIMDAPEFVERDKKLKKLADWSIKLVEEAIKNFSGNTIVDDSIAEARKVIEAYTGADKQEEFTNKLNKIIPE